jgi:trans-aconitate methyltransferase
MSLRQNIVSQFKQPRGTLGHLAGLIMANRPSNIERNQWTLDLLSLKASDRLLEIGFGPGLAIEQACRVITDGFIVGIDHSEVMLTQARKRNAAAISNSLVELYLGSLENLPHYEQPFTKICSANVVQFWKDPVADFSRLRTMLAPSGVIASTYMPRNKNASHADARNKASNIVANLKAAGFSNITVEEKPMKPVSAISVLAIND